MNYLAKPSLPFSYCGLLPNRFGHDIHNRPLPVKVLSCNKQRWVGKVPHYSSLPTHSGGRDSGRRRSVLNISCSSTSGGKATQATRCSVNVAQTIVGIIQLQQALFLVQNFYLSAKADIERNPLFWKKHNCYLN